MSARKRLIGLVGLLIVLLAVFFLLIPVPGPVFFPTGRARSEAGAVVAAMQAYRAEFGRYPNGDNAQVMAALRGANTKGMAFVKIHRRSANSKGEYLDPWGTPYAIAVSNNEVRVRSAGPDRRFGDVDDIRSWAEQ